MLALFVGISTGAGIMVAQHFGAKDSEALAKTIGNCISMTAIASLFIMIVGPLITGPLLRAVGTLPSMYDGCKAYLSIFFYGIAGGFFYNMFAGILRGLGDSFSALLYLMVTAALNIVLDLAFVDKMGVAGVALATVMAQFVSALLCLRKLLSLKSVFHLRKQDLCPERAYVSRILGLGLPSGVTQAIFSCAMMIVQRLINSFSDEMFVACNVMVMRVDGYAMLPNFSFGQAMGTYAGQNIGARRLDRLKDGTRQGLIMSVCTALVLTPAVLLAGPTLMRLFTPEQSLIELSMQMMYILAAGYVAMSVTQVLQGVMRGAGDTVTPMWISFGTAIGLRLPLAYILVSLAKNAGATVLTQEKMVFVSLLANWILGMVLTILLFKLGKWKRKLPKNDME
jgi:putative MATE family efflux protein